MIETATVYRIIIPNWHPVRLNDLMQECKTRKATFGRRKRLKQGDYDLIKAYSLDFPKARGPRSVKLIITLGPGQRAPDGDSQFKVALDGLVRCGMLANDSPNWCTPLPTEFVRGESHGTLIELRDL